jgi:2-polyprenyl-6-methoxyphenol hydroxylase-like FAD-dependent oxidoreductase
MLDARGLAGELISTGHTLDRLAMFDRVRLDMSRLHSRFPFVLITPQYQTERLLERRARALGAQIVGGSKVTGLRQQGDHVEVDVRQAADGETHARRASYVVGADGAHSAVRRSLGLPFPGRAVMRSIMLADVRLASQPPDLLQYDSAREGFAFIAPFGDGWYRIIAWDRQHEVPASEPVGLEEVRAVTRAALGTDYGMHDVRWISRFANDERQVTRYRSGRVFLAGDAAHVNSPAGGMAMNTGLQDAANLGWKLAAVAQGWADDALLDSYHAERHPVGRMVRHLSHGLLRMALLEPGPLREGLSLAGTALTRARPAADRVAGAISGIGIHYRAGGPHAHPLAGRRMPDLPLTGERGRLYEVLREGKFVLLAAADQVREAAPWAERIEVAARTREHPRLILVRPDGYIAWASDEADPDRRDDGLRQALTRYCGAPGQRQPARVGGGNG